MLALQNSDNALAYVTWHDFDGEKDKGVASGGNHTFIFYRTQYRKHEIFKLNSSNTAHACDFNALFSMSTVQST